MSPRNRGIELPDKPAIDEGFDVREPTADNDDDIGALAAGPGYTYEDLQIEFETLP